MTDPPEVLFVCVHNAGRSQMAAALLDHHANGKVQVRSAGSDPADRLSRPFAPQNGQNTGTRETATPKNTAIVAKPSRP